MASSTTDEPEEAAIEARIEAKARAFDVCALLDLLAEKGCPPAAIRRAGSPSSTSQPTWIDAVLFSAEGAQVEIAANLGLRSCRSPLPDYLRRLAADPDVGEPLEELLRLVDDRLLAERFASYRPERDPRVFPSFADTKIDLLRLEALRSPSALQWLFQKVFPELVVTARRARPDRRLPAPGVRLGHAELGVAAFGAEARAPVRGVEIALLCESRLSPIRRAEPEAREGHAALLPWSAIVEERIARLVKPALAGSGAHLAIALLVLDEEAAARLDGDGEHFSYLGYDPLRREAIDPPPLEPARPPRVVLHREVVF